MFFYGADRSANPYKFVNLDDDEIAAPFNYRGTVGCFSGNRNSGRYALRIFDGSYFLPKFYFNGNLPLIGGVEVQNHLIQWNAGPVHYEWGGKDDVFPVATQQMFTGSGNTVGLLKNLAPATFISSTGTTTSGGLQVFNTNYSATAQWKGLTAMPTFPAMKVGRIKEVKTTFGNIASGGRALTLSFKTDTEQTTTTIFSGVSSILSTGLTRSDRLDSSGNPLPKFQSINPVLQWSTGSGATDAPSIKEIEVIFELRNV